MLEWTASHGNTHRPFDGTITSLARCYYQTDEASPYRQLARRRSIAKMSTDAPDTS